MYWFDLAFVFGVLLALTFLFAYDKVMPMRGATAYEWEWGVFYLRICHLKGQHWRWKPWRRIEFHYWYSPRDPVMRLLLWIGLVSRSREGTVIDFPFRVPSWQQFTFYLRGGWGKRVYLFRNLPHVVKWKKGRLLPRRWGGGVCGFEFGDRGH